MIETMFEERGWEDILYPRSLPDGSRDPVYAWRKDGTGLLIRPDQDDRWFTVLASDPSAGERLIRLTSFDDVTAAMDFCDRIAPLAEWHKGPEWLSTGCSPDLDKRMHEIALELTRRPNGLR